VRLIVVARGFTKAGPVGNPDDARAARLLLKDFVNGKILYCHPPPGISGEEFNKDHYTPSPVMFKPLNPNAPAVADHRAEVDDGFFKEGGVRARTKEGVFPGRNMQYGHQKAVGDNGAMLSRKERKLREEMAQGRGKKHFKGRGKK
jgi:large subunit GTPase 1